MKSPKAPDPNQMAAAQANANMSTGMMQQMMNFVNQQTPYGSSTYTPTGSYSYKDPITGKMRSVPNFTLKQEFSPEQQALMGQEQEFDKMYNDIALRQTRAMGEHLATPFKYSTGDYEKWAGNLYGNLTGDTEAANRRALETRLANQGVSAGSAAYDDQMRNMNYGQQKARNDFMLGAYDTGFNQALTERNQPIQEIAALMGGGQIQQPQFMSTPQVSMSTPDMGGMMSNQYNQQVAQQNAMIGGLSGLGAAALGGWGMNNFQKPAFLS